jgi:hypothetical protein
MPVLTNGAFAEERLVFFQLPTVLDMPVLTNGFNQAG